jgi:hypothetical protein
LEDCFEGVEKVEGLVGDGDEVLGGQIHEVADDDGSNDYGGGVESVELAGARIVLEMAAVIMTPLLVETMIWTVVGVPAVAVVAVVAVVAKPEQEMVVLGSGLMFLLIAEVLGIGEEEHRVPSQLQSVVQGMAMMRRKVADHLRIKWR